MEANNTYGQKICTIYEQLCSVSVTEDEVQKYFPLVQEAPEQPETEEDTITDIMPDQNVDVPVVEQEPVVPDVEIEEPISDDKASGIATIVFEVLKKLITMILKFFSKGE
jgi:hypothetical protein